jgi:hypothetical protein
MMTTLRRIPAVVLALCLGVTALAEDGPVLLTITGLGDPVTFDLAQLKALKPETFETTTIWTEGVETFTGVSLATLMDELGVEDGTLEAMAINDYAVEVPVSDAVEGGPIVAYLMNGKEMSVRDKGPLWIVYPYDANPDYQSEVTYSRSIWQLDRIDVTE